MKYLGYEIKWRSMNDIFCLKCAIHENLVFGQFNQRFASSFISLITSSLQYFFGSFSYWRKVGWGVVRQFSCGWCCRGSNWKIIAYPPIFLEESTIKAIKISGIEKDVPLTFLTIFNFHSYSTKDSDLSIVHNLLFLEPKCRVLILISFLAHILVTNTP